MFHSYLKMLELWDSLWSKLGKLLRMFMAAAQQLLLLLAIIAFRGKCNKIWVNDCVSLINFIRILILNQHQGE